MHIPSANNVPATWCNSGSPFGYSPAFALHAIISFTNLFFVGSSFGNARSTSNNFPAQPPIRQPCPRFSPPSDIKKPQHAPFSAVPHPLSLFPSTSTRKHPRSPPLPPWPAFRSAKAPL